MRTLCGVGTDIVELSRLRTISSLARFSEFALTAGELSECAARADKVAFVASRFAVKEAVIKAHPSQLNLQDFEIRKDGVKPVVYFFDPEHRVCRMRVSLSHSTEYAAGYAIAEYI